MIFDIIENHLIFNFLFWFLIGYGKETGEQELEAAGQLLAENSHQHDLNVTTPSERAVHHSAAEQYFSAAKRGVLLGAKLLYETGCPSLTFQSLLTKSVTEVTVFFWNTEYSSYFLTHSLLFQCSPRMSSYVKELLLRFIALQTFYIFLSVCFSNCLFVWLIVCFTFCHCFASIDCLSLF